MQLHQHIFPQIIFVVNGKHGNREMHMLGSPMAGEVEVLLPPQTGYLQKYPRPRSVNQEQKQTFKQIDYPSDP